MTIRTITQEELEKIDPKDLRHLSLITNRIIKEKARIRKKMRMGNVVYGRSLLNYLIERLPQSILKPTRKEWFVAARWVVAMHLVDNGLSYPQVASIFRKKEHTTIMNGVKKGKTFLEIKDDKFMKVYNEITEHINNFLPESTVSA